MRNISIHQLAEKCREESEKFRVNMAFEKFLRAVTPSRFDRTFGHLGEILRLFQDCARSVVIDDWRRRKRRKRGLEEMAEQLRAESEEVSVEERAIANVTLDEFCERSRELLKDEQERLAFRLSYEAGLKPADITRLYPKERIVKRLAGDPWLRQWWEGY